MRITSLKNLSALFIMFALAMNLTTACSKSDDNEGVSEAVVNFIVVRTAASGGQTHAHDEHKEQCRKVFNTYSSHMLIVFLAQLAVGER